jgi:hypothetical protein
MVKICFYTTYAVFHEYLFYMYLFINKPVKGIVGLQIGREVRHVASAVIAVLVALLPPFFSLSFFLLPVVTFFSLFVALFSFVFLGFSRAAACGATGDARTEGTPAFGAKIPVTKNR